MMMGMRGWLPIAAACVVFCSVPAPAATNVPFLLVSPEKWWPATSNYIPFKTRLGFNVYTASLEAITGADTQNYGLVREYLRWFRTNSVPTNYPAYVLLLGDFSAVPAPSFQVAGGDTPYRSDVYHRSLYTEFDLDGDGIFGEYDALDSTQDVHTATFSNLLNSISNDLVVGRIPFPPAWDAAGVERVLDGIRRFEREVCPRKRQSLMTAGRIDTNLLSADSWDYALRGIVGEVFSNYPDREMVTVVHVATGRIDRAGMDHVVEGGNIPVDYTVGQDIVRGLWQASNQCSFLCNVSHGSANYDFALRRNGAGFPTNVDSAIVMSMSCASYPLGSAAVTSGLAAAYLGSVAVVSPDVTTILGGAEMVSARVQKMATLRIYCQSNSVGEAFRECFDYYIDEIQAPAAALFYAGYKPEILRNVVGFQVIGDPALVHSREDADGDALLDPEEEYLGLCPTNADTDADGLPDGWEFYTNGVSPWVFDGLDVDTDRVANADEIIAGTSPLNGGEYPRIEFVAPTGLPVVVEWNSVSGRFYQVESCAGLHLDSWAELGGAMTGADARLSYQDTNEAGAFYYRLRISR